VPISSLLAFWLVAVLLIVVPGPDWAFTISAGLQGRSVLPAVGGLVLGYSALTLVVAAGVGAVVAGSPGALTGLTVVGGCYLIWHGTRTFRHPVGELAPAGGPSSGRGTRSGWDVLWRGVGVSGLNPKGLLLFIALLPQFADARAAWPFAVQVGVLGLAFTLTCGVFYTGLGQFARAILQAHPRAAGRVTRASGAAMVVVGLVLIADRLVG
jgi:threonine/homoserine/homoserine lactone efflux protein